MATGSAMDRQPGEVAVMARLGTATMTIAVNAREATIQFTRLQEAIRVLALRYQIDRHLRRCAAHRARRRRQR